MKTFNPRVSIVIPVYNGSQYLGEAIDSALAQTYKNLEIIVSNDGSNDNGATEAVAKSYGKKIIYLGKKKNGGASTALNAAIKVMTGEYFSWLSHDDMYYPKKIQRQVEELAKLKNKNTVMMSDLDGINEKKQKIYQTNYSNHIKEYPLRVKSLIHPVLYNQTHGCTLLIPKVCFDKVGLFDVGERVAQDFECFNRIFQKYPHKLVPEVLVTARDTSNRMGRRAKPRASIEYSRLYIGILESLSEKDVALLAKDKLALFSDMWSFFKAAGYIQAYEYITNMIVDFSYEFCSSKIIEFTKGLINSDDTTSELTRIRDQLGLVLGDNEESTMRIDNIIHGIVSKLDISFYKNKIESAMLLQASLLNTGYKLSSATLLKSIIVFLSETSQLEKLNKVVADRVTGSSTLPLFDEPIDAIKSNKPVIAFCSTHWLTGGMERVMSIVFNQIKDRYDIVLITPYDGVDSEIVVPDGIRHIKISNLKFQTEFDSTVLTVALLYNVDVLVGFFNLYSQQLDLYTLCKEAGIKTIASNHESFFYPYSNYGLQRLAFKRLEIFKTLDAVVWPTNFSAAVSGLSSHNNYLMPNPNTFKPMLAEKKKEQAIICVGRFNDYIKRVDRILEAFKLIQDRVPESKLFLVGDCDREKRNEALSNKSINDLIIELGIDENNILFTGNVSNVAAYYKRASVLMLTSDSEGFGMVVNEAASFGVPTVYNAIPGLDDLIVDGKNGFVVEQDDILGMATRVVEILKDEELAKRMSRDAIALSRRFDASIIGRKWAYLIDNLLNGKQGVDLRKDLNRKLAYNVPNQLEFSKLMFNEFDQISKKLVDMQNNLDFGSIIRSSYYRRLVFSISQEGKRRTVKKIARKIYHKSGARRFVHAGVRLNNSLKKDGAKKTVKKVIDKIKSKAKV